MPLTIIFSLILLLGGYAFGEEEGEPLWQPSGACLGLVLSGMLVTLGWWAGFSAIAGMVAHCLLCACFAIHRFRSGPRKAAPLVEDWPAISFCFVIAAVVAVEFYPLLKDAGRVNPLPAIFDLPKHISALAACARTTQFPVVNPWLPQADFAYPTSFYAPFAAIAAALGTSTGVVRTTAALPVVSAFLILAMIAAAGRRLGLSRISVLLSLLLASVVGGYTAALANSGSALGANLAMAKRLGGLPWFEDPFTYFVFIPNHVFAVTCILAGWHAMNRRSAGMANMVRGGLLLAGAVQASGALVPHAAFAALVLFVFQWWNGQEPLVRDRRVSAATMMTVFGVCAFPFGWIAYRWGQGSERVGLDFVFDVEGWMTQLIAIGPFAALFLVGLGMAWLKGSEWRSLIVLLLPGLAFLCAVPHMDIALKSTMFIRLLGVLFAALPLAWLIEQKRTRARDVLLAGVALCFLHASYFSSQLTVFLLKSAYNKWDPSLARLVRSLQDLPFAPAVEISPPNQELAALSGHLVFMDFTPFRAGGYLPTEQIATFKRPLDLLARLASGVCPDSQAEADKNANNPLLLGTAANRLLAPGQDRAEAIGYVLLSSSRELLCNGFQAVDSQPFDLLPQGWAPWPGPLANVTLDPNSFTVASTKLVDAGLVKTLRLTAGRYHIVLKVSGKVTGPASGAAHLSILGKSKLISIPPGEYDSTLFEAPFESSIPISETLAFGLGGWALGAGTLRLEGLTFILSATPR